MKFVVPGLSAECALLIPPYITAVMILAVS